MAVKVTLEINGVDAERINPEGLKLFLIKCGFAVDSVTVRPPPVSIRDIVLDKFPRFRPDKSKLPRPCNQGAADRLEYAIAHGSPIYAGDYPQPLLEPDQCPHSKAAVITTWTGAVYCSDCGDLRGVPAEESR